MYRLYIPFQRKDFNMSLEAAYLQGEQWFLCTESISIPSSPTTHMNSHMRKEE